jgi:hypothetical protein
MTIKSMKALLETLDENLNIRFLCPDGFADDIEAVYEQGDGELIFVSYIHRNKNHKTYKEKTDKRNRYA